MSVWRQFTWWFWWLQDSYDLTYDPKSGTVAVSQHFVKKDSESKTSSPPTSNASTVQQLMEYHLSLAVCRQDTCFRHLWQSEYWPRLVCSEWQTPPSLHCLLFSPWTPKFSATFTQVSSSLDHLICMNGILCLCARKYKIGLNLKVSELKYVLHKGKWWHRRRTSLSIRLLHTVLYLGCIQHD